MKKSLKQLFGDALLYPRYEYRCLGFETLCDKEKVNAIIEDAVYCRFRYGSATLCPRGIGYRFFEVILDGEQKLIFNFDENLEESAIKNLTKPIVDAVELKNGKITSCENKIPSYISDGLDELLCKAYAFLTKDQINSMCDVSNFLDRRLEWYINRLAEDYRVNPDKEKNKISLQELHRLGYDMMLIADVWEIIKKGINERLCYYASVEGVDLES